ncbi:MAG TPA: tetratricopeptide repeat protein [Polyangia bacterium]
MNPERRALARGARLALLIPVSLAVMAPALPALAEPTVSELIQEGVALRRKGDDEGALQRFQKAYGIKHDARVLGQMGMAEQALGRWVQAHEDLSRALEATTDPWIVKNVTTLRGALSDVDEHVGKLEILGGSPDAEISVDGVARGKLPLGAPLILPIGTVSLRLSGAGLVPVQRSTQIRAHQSARESFDPLAVASATAIAVPLAVAVAPSPERPAPSEPPPPASAAEHAVPSRARQSAKWIAWGGATVALGVGVFGYAWQRSATNEFNDGCAVDPSGNVTPQPGKSISSDRCLSLKSRRDTGFDLEVGGVIGFAAAAAAGAILWLTEPAPSSTQAALAACSPGVGPRGTVGLGCGWRF